MKHFTYIEQDPCQTGYCTYRKPVRTGCFAKRYCTGSHPQGIPHRENCSFLMFSGLAAPLVTCTVEDSGNAEKKMHFAIFTSFYLGDGSTFS